MSSGILKLKVRNAESLEREMLDFFKHAECGICFMTGSCYLIKNEEENVCCGDHLLQFIIRKHTKTSDVMNSVGSLFGSSGHSTIKVGGH